MKTKGMIRQLSKWFFATCGIWLIAIGVYFIFARPPLLPEDLRYMGTDMTKVGLMLPKLAPWLRNVFIVLGGFIAGCGVLTIFISVHAISERLRGTGIALGWTGLLTVATMSGTNFALDSDFKWPLLALAIVWLLGLVSYVAGKETLHAVAGASHSDILT